jgi:hypothetical protein
MFKDKANKEARRKTKKILLKFIDHYTVEASHLM